VLCFLRGVMAFSSDKIARRAERIYREVKPFALYGIILLAGYLLYPIVWPYLSRPEVLAVIVAMMAVAIFNLSREAARKPPRPNKRFLKKLFRSEQITPQHDPPKEAGGKYGGLGRALINAPGRTTYESPLCPESDRQRPPARSSADSRFNASRNTATA
jgi:hypothetical protein